MIKLNNRTRIYLTIAILGVSVVLAYFSHNAEISLNKSSAAVAPELPRAYVDTSYPSLSSTRTIRTVKTSCSGLSSCYTSLQQAIDASAQGDEIIVDAGMTITGPITLKNKTAGSGWTVIRTSNMSGITSDGVRVSPANASAMPKILAPSTNEPAIRAENQAHNYRLVGLEVTEPANDNSNVLIQLGPVNSLCGSATDLYKICDQSVLALYPYNLVLDRMYIHGTSTHNVKRGVSMDSKSAAVINSYLTEFHVVGQDAQAISGLYGPGPYKIYNNYIAGAGENILFGGDDPRVEGLIPSDIEFRKNYFTKPLTWRPGDPTFNGRYWTVKNIFELKNAQRVLIDGNIFENSWVEGQVGYAILFNTANQNGSCLWCAVMDITFTNNLVRHAASGIEIQANAWRFPDSTGLTQRVKIENNLLEDIDGTKWKELTSTRTGPGLFVDLPSTNVHGPNDISVNHNTVIQTGRISNMSNCTNKLTGANCSNTAESDKQFWTKPRFDFRNNIVNHSTYGFFGEASTMDNSSLNSYFPGASITKNIIVGQRSSTDTRDWSGNFSSYPGNYFPKTWSNIGFIDFANGNYRLASASPYKGKASDGRDIGADLDALDRNISGVVSGTPEAGPLSLPSSIDPVTPPPTPAPSQSSSDIVIHVRDIPSASIIGKWNLTADSTGASGYRIANPNAGYEKKDGALTVPPDYFEASFNALGQTPYHVWLRMKAEANDFNNDSVWMQFSDSLDSSGNVAYRIGSVSGLSISLEEGVGAGLSGWGWNDNDYGGLGTNIKFANTGKQTLRIQPRQDGVSIDQIVLSPASFLSTRPGTTKNDSTILAKTALVDSTPPVFASFSVSPVVLNAGSNVTANFAVTDAGGSYLSHVRFMRSPYNSTNCSETTRTACSWAELGKQDAPANSNSWSGTMTDTPAQGEYLYGMQIYDNAGNRTLEPKLYKVTVNNPLPKPTVSFSVSPASITSGASAMLSWVTADAATVSIEPGIGMVATSGSKTVNPQSDTVYTLTATNATGSETRTATLTVTAALPPPPPPPSVDTAKPTVSSFTVSPQTATYPATITASFSATDTGGSYINHAELYRADYDSAGCSETVFSGCSWLEILRKPAPLGINSWSDSLQDMPNPGTFWYGVHIVDNAGNWGWEPRMVKVTISSAALPPAPLPPPPTSDTRGLKGSYFSNRTLSSLAYEQNDDTVNFDWGNDGPLGLGTNNFSVRWSGLIQPKYSETYKFTSLSDDGVRLWVNGKLIIDNWTEHSRKEDTGVISLEAGKKYNIKLEYFERLGSSVIKLYWQSASQSKEIVPNSALYTQ